MIIATLNEAKNQLLTVDRWAIQKMWSNDQSKAVALEIETWSVARINDGS